MTWALLASPLPRWHGLFRWAFPREAIASAKRGDGRAPDPTGGCAAESSLAGERREHFLLLLHYVYT